jgi:HAE1 family hydrophobic/amphiphilic exporter-1
MRMPSSFLPDEDQGILMCQIIMPTGATLEQTQEVADQVKTHFLENEKEAVESCMTVAGMGFSGRAQNNGMVFVKLKDWELRDRDDLRVKAIAAGPWPRLPGCARRWCLPSRRRGRRTGHGGGVDFQLVDRGGLGHDALMAARNQFLYLASQDPRLANVPPHGMEDVPEFRVDVDWEKAGALGVPINGRSQHAVGGVWQHLRQ